MKTRLYPVRWLVVVSSFFVLPAFSHAGNNDCAISAKFQCKFNKAFSAKTTDNLAQGATNKYWSSALFNAAFSAKTTDNLAEGSSNLYFTQGRFDSAFSGKSSDDLSEGSTNHYYTEARFDSSLSAKTTDNVAEGSSNLYFTQGRFESALSGKSSDDLSEGSTNLYYTEDRFDASLEAKTSDDITEGSNNKYSQWSENGSAIYYDSGFVGIGTTDPREHLNVDGSILIPSANGILDESPGITAQENDDFMFNGDVLYHYGIGWHHYSDNDHDNGLSAYLSGYNGVDIFTSGQRRIRVNSNGFVGIGFTDENVVPSYPLHMVSGAYVSEEGVWTDASSIQFKQDVVKLGLQKAQEALMALNPVMFHYKVAPHNQYVGFIAEEVPELVAMEGRKGLSPMDIVAVLTKVVQNQQMEIESLKARLEKLENNKNGK